VGNSASFSTLIALFRNEHDIKVTAVVNRGLILEFISPHLQKLYFNFTYYGALHCGPHKKWGTIGATSEGLLSSDALQLPF